MGSLYVVSTPIGNLEDITLRAINTLKKVDTIISEDTRITKRLLKKFEIITKTTSYHKYNQRSKLPKILNELSTSSMALVSDAGTPGINDPGSILISEARKMNVQIIPIPGPSAVTTALSISGLNSDSFIHLGFLPQKKGKKQKALLNAKNNLIPTIFFESPYRFEATINLIIEIMGNRNIIVCREMTKIYEQIFHGQASQALETISPVKGEFTIILDPTIKNNMTN
ncbi:MAG: 16S rRNA (cytidine(1402)-2'-O)-methyltransferase [Dehalococcoidia bacterium]